MQVKKHGILHIVGTPLGNLADITPRATQTLENATVVACEDTRRTGLLLQKLGIKAPKLISSHKENERTRIPDILSLLAEGHIVALVSDGGMPAISDPGAVVVQAARQAGYQVEVIPGATAATTALAGAGFEGGFVFPGFLPRKGPERRQALTRLGTYPESVVLYESPHRLKETCEDLLTAWGNRPAYVARELTKMYEEWIGPTLQHIITELASRPEVKGECVLVVEGCKNQAAQTPESDWQAEAETRHQTGENAKSIAADIAQAYGLSRRMVYQHLLTHKG